MIPGPYRIGRGSAAHGYVTLPRLTRWQRARRALSNLPARWHRHVQGVRMAKKPATRLIHPDWPAVLISGGVDQETPVDDLAFALGMDEWASNNTATAEPFPQPCERLTLDQVASIERYLVTYDSDNYGAGPTREWTPGGRGGTELTMHLVGQLVDGRWFSVDAGNDYTGWGCQDHSNVRVGATEDDVVRHGLTSEGRRALGYEEAP